MLAILSRPTGRKETEKKKKKEKEKKIYLMTDPHRLDSDPHRWLEDVLGDAPLAWVRLRNAECISAIGDPAQTETYQRILDVLGMRSFLAGVQDR